MLCGLFCFLLVGGGAFFAYKTWKKKQGDGEDGLPILGGTVDITRLELGVQAQSRTQIQQHLDSLAESANLDTEEGLLAFLREIILSLQRNKEAVDYGHVEVIRRLTHEGAEPKFQGWANEARGKYDREVIRRDTLGTRKTQRNVETENELVDEDGDLAVAEYFVVTLLVAKDGGVTIPEKLQDTHELDAVLNELNKITAQQLMVVEVIWSPSAESDTMSRDDLSMTYPELFLL